jgi:putative redox protein
MTSAKVEFPGATAAKLAARLDSPPVPRAYALFAHCFTCGKDIFAASRIAAALVAQGIAVLRFDFTGLGGSEGEFSNTNFSSNVRDLLAAGDFLRQHYAAPTLLIGHSLGGAAALSAAPRVPEVRAIATIGAPSKAAHVVRSFGAQVGEIAEKGRAEVTLAGRKFTIAKQFLDDLADQQYLGAVATMKKALLVCHAPHDDVVGIENASEIFAAARHPKSFLSLDSADHLLRRREDAIYVADVITAWASRYLPASDAVMEEPLAAGQVVVSETRTGRYTQAVRAGRHRLLSDEPVAVGGDDAGPGPYDYLLGALGACTSMTLRMYVEHKNLPVEHISTHLAYRNVHEKDCAECETRNATIGEITREITITGNLDETARVRLMEIADKCPVHRTLSGKIKIVSQLSIDGKVSG